MCNDLRPQYEETMSIGISSEAILRLELITDMWAQSHNNARSLGSEYADVVKYFEEPELRDPKNEILTQRIAMIWNQTLQMNLQELQTTIAQDRDELTKANSLYFHFKNLAAHASLSPQNSLKGTNFASIAKKYQESMEELQERIGEKMRRRSMLLTLPNEPFKS